MWSFPVIAISVAPPGVVRAFPLPQPAFGGTLWQPGDPAERFGFNMKQISTGAGLVALSVGMVATAFIVSQRGGSEAFAQGTGTERRIVAQGVYGADVYNLAVSASWAYRVWSDNVTEVKYLGIGEWDVNNTLSVRCTRYGGSLGVWQVVDDGTSAFLQADVDRSTQVDAGDISAILLDFGNRNDETPPPPIDCTINGPR
jgi:hypothetical protein